MTTTCRTCAESVMEPRCNWFGRPFSYGAKRGCPHWHKRETPLLVDELAEAVRRLLVPRFAFDPQWAVEVEFGEAVMSRYQKEVGDDKT